MNSSSQLAELSAQYLSYHLVVWRDQCVKISFLLTLNVLYIHVFLTHI